MKNKILFLSSLIMIFFMSACKKDSNVSNADTLPASNPITDTNLKGFLKGTLLADKTYTLVGDVFIKSVDTLGVQQGVTVRAKGNFGFYVSGTIIAIGTSDKPLTFTTDSIAPKYGQGYWAGFRCDSAAKQVVIKWAHINYTGGPDSRDGEQFAVRVHGISSGSYNSATKVVLEDCWFRGGIDDALRLEGPIKISIKRNTIQHCGNLDGDNINIKTGVTGDVAYNYIWASANNGIKLNTGKVLFPETKVNIYNNTLINCGYRKTGEPTNSILIDSYAAGSVYNNLIIGSHTGIRITKAADIANCTYGNNLIVLPSDSLKDFYYPIGDWTTKQASDVILTTGLANCATVITTWDSNVYNDNDTNVPALLSGSPALNKGNVSAPTTDIAIIPGSSSTPPNKDLGAYPSDGSGNKHVMPYNPTSVTN